MPEGEEGRQAKIAGLIERLDSYIPPKGSVLEALHNDIRHTLSRLTTPPPDEIAGLIDVPTLVMSLKHSCHKVITSAEDKGRIVELLAVQMTRDSLNVVIDALSRLTAPPPDEIARLIEKAELMLALRTTPPIVHEMAAALRALAQENGRLKSEEHTSGQTIDALLQRIRELEAERDEQKAMREVFGDERDAIRRKTIEECAQEAEWFINIEKFTAWAVAARIRALAHSERGEANDPLVPSAG